MFVERIKEFYNKSLLPKAIVFTVAFLFFRFSSYGTDSLIYLAINELLFIHLAYFWFYLGISKIVLKRNSILPSYNLLIFLSGIFLAAVTGIYFLFNQISYDELPGILQFFLSLLISGVFFVIIEYSFVIFSKFYFYRQRENQKGFFRAMLILLLFYATLKILIPYLEKAYDLATLFPSIFSSLGSFTNIVKISLAVLVLVNSMRVSWIAKLSKQEKIGLIIRSFFLAIILFVSLILVHLAPQITTIANSFSAMFYYSLLFVLVYGTANASMVFFTTIFHLPTAEESDKKTAELNMLWGLGKMLNEIFDLHELGESIVTLAKQAGNTRQVSLIIISKNEKIIVTEKMSENDVRNLFTEIKNLKTDGKFLIFDLNDRLGAKILSRHGIERLLAVPLKLKNEKRGYLFLSRKFEEENFDDDEIDAVIGLADYAALALSKAELLKASIEKERMEKELEVAREIQRKIIPREIPSLKNFEISAQFIPAFEVGGDYYDFFNINDSLAFVIADVSGKGIEASYTMAEIKGIFEALSQTDENIEKLIIRANDILLKRLGKKNFVTAIIGVIFENEILYYRLGHNKPVLVNETNVEVIDSKGLAFGIAPSEVFAKYLQAVKIPLNNNEAIVFYTDGINEAMNDLNEEFGYRRFFEILKNTKHKTADEMALSVIKEVSTFSNRNIQNDDITILIIKRK